MLLASVQVLHAGEPYTDAVQDMRKNAPQAAEALANAVQRGDFSEAQKIFQNYQNSRKPEASGSSQPEGAPGSGGGPTPVPSLFERTLSGQFPGDAPSGLRQFGYDLFSRTASPFAPGHQVPVGPDYLIGPGDQFTLTLWGTTEGIFAMQVTKEGNVTLPKVGVVPVAGIRFGELERTLRKHLSRYYSNFNLSVAMGTIKTITVYVVGEVENPGSYSLSSLISAYGALFAAGGPTKKGTLRSIQVLRSGKIIKTIDIYDFLLKGDRSQDVRLQNEDTVFVPLIGPVAGVSGMVYRPAIYELKGEESLGGLLNTAGGILPIGLGSRIQLNRFTDNSRQEVMDIILRSSSPGKGNDAVELKAPVRNMDLVTVFPIYEKVWETVSITGEVRQPGTYQWRAGLRLGEALRQAVFLPTADLRRAEIVRMSEDFTDRKILPVDLAGVLAGDALKDPELLPRDHIRVFTAFRTAEKVTVSGEVGNPGEYEISRDERLSDLLGRINGFTSEAYPYGMAFKRRDVKNAQAANLRTFVTRMQQQILQAATTDVATALSKEESGIAVNEMTMNQSLLANLRAMQELFEGRVAVNVSTDIAAWAGTKDDLLLQDGDVIHVPKKPQEVMVMGEVHSPGALIHVPDLAVKDYVGQTGGLTDYANEDQVYVLQANGFAYSAESPSVGDLESMKLRAGDTVFVPQKIERYAAMRYARDIVDILFKTAVVIATITILF
jgi:protein involved in polysaccharide export with SLBB domain